MIADMEIVPVRAFSDNYIWLLSQGHYSVVVDPGDAAPVLDRLSQEGLSLSAILITHRHHDHVGGVARLLAEYRVPVYAPRGENLDFPFIAVGEGDRVEIPQLGCGFDVLDVPGHTARHAAYYGGNSLFCGDTLFGCGCGRVFDGSCSALYHSLQKLAALPDATQVYCAHEYTLSNLRFARFLEPENRTLETRESVERAKIERGEPTLPSTIALEKATNPFLRCGDLPLRLAALRSDPAKADSEEAVFCVLRELKNRF
jgi:hydroxyacylglutathione hydrolase